MAIICIGCNSSKPNPDLGKTTPPSVSEKEDCEIKPDEDGNDLFEEFDGLAQSVFDNTVRIRNRLGSGSGSIVADLGDAYEVETNRHVAQDNGFPNVVDIWNGGDLVWSKYIVTKQSWFQDRRSKDIAIIHIPKSKLDGKALPVIETAPQGFTLRKGDKIFTVGCSDARWPRARCGSVLDLRNGLIYYDPKSIGGDSGSAVYAWSKEDQKFYAVGRTAWAIQENGRWVGLAMDSNRVRAIRRGEVSDGWELPEDAVQIDTILPAEAVIPEHANQDSTAPPFPKIVQLTEPMPVETLKGKWKIDYNQDKNARLGDGSVLRNLVSTVRDVRAEAKKNRPILTFIKSLLYYVATIATIVVGLVAYLLIRFR